jgi:hypothetical protein
LTPKIQNRSKYPVIKILLASGLLLLLIAEGFFGFRLRALSAQQQQIKSDFSNANGITQGLLSVDQWRGKVADIVNHQVRHFTLTPAQKAQLQTEVEQVLYALIDTAEAKVNKQPKTLSGKIKKLAVKAFVKPDKIRKQVPAFAHSIIAKIDNPQQKSQLSDLAMGKLNEAQHSGSLDSTQRANQAQQMQLYHRYGVSSSDGLNHKLDYLLNSIRTEMYRYVFGMLLCILVVLFLWWIFRARLELHVMLFVFSLFFAFVLLAVGLSAAMIEVDCRIRALDFVLLDEHIVFRNQVLFYQSKSILDVVKVLISQPAIDSIFVGILILCFSILFPLMKLFSTGIHLLSKRKLAENRLIKYFAFQSGKWSMADVIVIAVLMTYIGLNGLLDRQLAALNIHTNTLTIITTNNTALQPGYIIFISFVLYGLVLSTILKYITPYDAH